MSSLVTRLLPQGKLLQKSAAGLNSVLQKTASNDLSTSSPVQGSLTIPERLQGIPEAQVRKNIVDIFGENIFHFVYVTNKVNALDHRICESS